MDYPEYHLLFAALFALLKRAPQSHIAKGSDSATTDNFIAAAKQTRSS